MDIMAWALKPEQQAYTYDKGYFYPGPAIQNVPLSMAPATSQSTLAAIWSPGVRHIGEYHYHCSPLVRR